MACKERTHKVPREWKNQVRYTRKSRSACIEREPQVFKDCKSPEYTISRSNTVYKKRTPKAPKEWKRAGHTIEHHIINSCNGGKSVKQNLLVFDENREKAWHSIFHNLSFTEAAQKLKLQMIMFDSIEIKAFNFLFQDKSFDEVAELLLRTVRAKNAQY